MYSSLKGILLADGYVGGGWNGFEEDTVGR
jgi:hypothetical protein